MIVASLLILVFIFAGTWIITYVQPGTDPWTIVPWFAAAAAAIVVIGVLAGLFRRDGRG
jgi:hypothetical protein